MQVRAEYDFRLVVWKMWLTLFEISSSGIALIVIAVKAKGYLSAPKE